MKERYADTEFGSKYGYLSIEDTFVKMGVTEYSFEAGQDIDAYRMAAVESEYSTEIAKDKVIRPVAAGLELKGNVIRPA
jgi:molecular chaperone GrpE (heat shock protein)